MNKRLVASLAAAGLLLGACGGDDGATTDTATSAAGASTASSAASTSAAASASSAAPTTAAATPTTAAATPSSAAATTAASTATSAAPAGPVAASLAEWTLTAPTAVKAGAVTFEVANAGEAPHEFAVMKGTYESLPKSGIGAVLENETAAGTVIGRTDRIEPGSSATLTVDLPAGQYVLLCNIAAGPNSHAGKGQRLDITVG